MAQAFEIVLVAAAEAAGTDVALFVMTVNVLTTMRKTMRMLLLLLRMTMMMLLLLLVAVLAVAEGLVRIASSCWAVAVAESREIR